MGRLAPQTLKQIEPAKEDGTLDLGVGGDCLTYEVGSWDEFLIDALVVLGTWAAGQTLTVLCSMDGSRFVTYGGMAPLPVGAFTDSIVGPIEVSGLKQVRLAIASPSGTVGSNKIRPLVRAYQDPS